MTNEERLTEIEDELRELKGKRKDNWDKLAITSSVLIPLAIAAVGGTYSYFSQRSDTQIAIVQAAAESKLKQAELVSKFFEPLTGSDPYRRELAVQSLLIAAKDYGPILVRNAYETAPTEEAASYAKNALNERRDTIIREMFDTDPESRKEAYTQLLASWGSDESLIEALISYGSANQSNANGIYNTLVLLSHMNVDVIKTKTDNILAFAKLVENNGPKTKKRVNVLRERLKK